MNHTMFFVAWHPVSQPFNFFLHQGPPTKYLPHKIFYNFPFTGKMSIHWKKCRNYKKWFLFFKCILMLILSNFKILFNVWTHWKSASGPLLRTTGVSQGLSIRDTNSPIGTWTAFRGHLQRFQFVTFLKPKTTTKTFERRCKFVCMTLATEYNSRKCLVTTGYLICTEGAVGVTLDGKVGKHFCKQQNCIITNQNRGWKSQVNKKHLCGFEEAKAIRPNQIMSSFSYFQ